MSHWFYFVKNSNYDAIFVYQKGRSINSHVLLTHEFLEPIGTVLFRNTVIHIGRQIILNTHLVFELFMRFFAVRTDSNYLDIGASEFIVISSELGSFSCASCSKIPWIKIQDYFSSFKVR